MPLLSVNGAEIYYEIHGDGPETIVFSHGFLMSSKMFQHQVDKLKDRFTVIAYDHRGQGKSEITDTGYAIDDYTEDAYQLIEEIIDSPVHFVGLSTGGFVGLRLALRYPEKIKSLVLMNTSAESISLIKKIRFGFLRYVTRVFGFKPVIKPVMQTLFGQTFLQDDGKKEVKEQWRDHLLNNNKLGMYRAFEAAMKREDLTDRLFEIAVPCLVIGGEEDVALSPEEAEHMDEHLSHSQLEILEDTGHSSSIESPERVTNSILEFLDNIE